MIQSVSDSSPAALTADPTSSSAASKHTVHTPFGDVLVDEMSAPDLAGLMSPKTASPAAVSTLADTSAPSAQDSSSPVTEDSSSSLTPDAQALFGDHPWVDNPGGTGPNNTSWGFNPVYFATRQTADTVAKMIGGTVVEKNAILAAPGSPFLQNQPNEMIDLPNGAEVYAGVIADFYNHGYSQYWVNKLVQNEVQGTKS